jgi:hypothetical protein
MGETRAWALRFCFDFVDIGLRMEDTPCQDWLG